VVALEALAASPSSFAGGVIFEPAAVIGPPLSGDGGQVLTQARAALAAGRPGKAMAIFSRSASGLPRWQAWLVGLSVTLIPKYRRLVPCQLDSLEALDQLGVRLDTYATIQVPTVLLGGGSNRNPAHIRQRLDAIHRVMPHAERVVMPKRDHGADLKAPRRSPASSRRSPTRCCTNLRRGTRSPGPTGRKWEPFSIVGGLEQRRAHGQGPAKVR
jgi:hypothetical protein